MQCLSCASFQEILLFVQITYDKCQRLSVVCDPPYKRGYVTADMLATLNVAAAALQPKCLCFLLLFTATDFPRQAACPTCGSDIWSFSSKLAGVCSSTPIKQDLQYLCFIPTVFQLHRSHLTKAFSRLHNVHQMRAGQGAAGQNTGTLEAHLHWCCTLPIATTAQFQECSKAELQQDVAR